MVTTEVRQTLVTTHSKRCVLKPARYAVKACNERARAKPSSSKEALLMCTSSSLIILGLLRDVLIRVPVFSVANQTDPGCWGYITLYMKMAVARSVPTHVFEGILAGFLETTQATQKVNRRI